MLTRFQAFYDGDIASDLYLHTHIRKLKQEVSALICSPSQEPDPAVALAEVALPNSRFRTGRTLSLRLKYSVRCAMHLRNAFIDPQYSSKQRVSRVVSIFAPYWIINATGMPLTIKQV